MLTALATAWSLIRRIPREAWLIAAAIAALFMWGNHREAQGRNEGRAEVQAKWDRAKAEALAATRAEEARQAKLSKGADRAVIEKTATERDRTERFIAAGGVRNACPRTDQAAVPSAGSGEAVRGAPELDDAEQMPTVAVKATDVRICTTNTILAEEFRKVLLGIEAGK